MNNLYFKLTLIIAIQLQIFAISSCWKLRLCLNGSLVEAQKTEDCKYGIWFTKPKVLHKICFDGGVWAIYREFCQANPVIWTVHPGYKGCISYNEIGGKTLGIVSLGRHDLGAIISTPNRKLFFSNHKLKHGMVLNFFNSPAQVGILTWGPPSDTFSLHQVRDGTTNASQQCLIKGKHSFFAYYKVTLDSHKNVSIYLAKNICKSKFKGSRQQVFPAEIDFNILESSSEDTDFNCPRFIETKKQKEQPQDREIGLEQDWEDEGGNILNAETIRLIESRVDEETQRIVLHLIAHHFDDEETIEHKFEDWELLDMAVKIFDKTCPSNVVPTFFVNQIHLLFQGLLRESEKLFPNSVNTNKESTARILNYLETCFDNATTFRFKVVSSCARDVPLLKTQFANGTKVYMLVEMPEFMKIDVTNFDLITEAMWKMLNFVEYYCSYSLATAYDVSLLGKRWQDLFSPLAMRRWRYPGKSYEVMKKLFSSIDLDDTINHLDYCVSAARLHSSNKGWLRRPVSRWQRVKQADNTKGQKLIWGGEAHCLDDYTYPALKLGYPIEKCGINMPILPDERNVR